MMEDPEQPPSTGPSQIFGTNICGGICNHIVDIDVAECVHDFDNNHHAALVRFAQDALGALGCRAAELSVLLCDDSYIRHLNHCFRGVNTPTDVLSFGQDSTVSDRDQILGDVVISLETARRQALFHRVPEFAELRELLLHGILHLLGRDHGDGDFMEEPMLQEQKRLLEELT